MSNYNNYNDNHNLDYADEIFEETQSKKSQKENRSVMKDINRELKTLKQIEFKDFNLIMEDYHSGEAYRVEKAKEDACLNLKGFIIYMIMHKFWTYCRIHFFDMLQCGYIGVLKGLDAYDPAKAMPTTFFKTYIVCEISRYITEFLNGSTVHYATTLAKVKKAQRHFEEIGVEAKESAIAEFLGISPTSVREALASQEASISVNYQDEFENSSDEDVPSANNNFMNPEHYLEQKALSEAIADAMDELTSDEKKIIIMHYGFEGAAMTFRQISENTGFPMDKIKILHQSAINKMHSAKLGMLYDDKYKSLPGIEVYEFMPESEEEAEIVDFSFDDFMDAQMSAYNTVQCEAKGANNSVPVLPDYTVQCNVSFLSGLR